jgi:alkanesulfonate monooxygenase SsuD/methylene tetrahydromethanopterin reductase-like flavin-dependent oxidoreductase (luciferase family)
MKFGYFTLSDNHYEVNPRTVEQFMDDIVVESIHADKIGMYSVWIGEHHFNRRGSIPCPQLLLAAIAREAPTVRLAPAVVVLPCHNPIAVAEEWATLDRLSGGRVDFAAGRGYDAVEYRPFGADFSKSAEMFEEGIDLLWRCWTEKGPFSFSGTYYNCEDIEVFPHPIQQPMVPHIACFSPFSMELAAKRGWPIVFAPFAAAVVFGSLKNAVAAYREACAKYGTKPARAVCSYFIHVGGEPKEEEYGRDCLMQYFRHSGMQPPKSPVAAAAGKMPSSMAYYMKVRQWLADVRKDQLDDASILLGSAERIIDSLGRIEEAGLDEVILYFNHGLKPHKTVLDQMDRFMADVAPAFAARKVAAQ